MEFDNFNLNFINERIMHSNYLNNNNNNSNNGRGVNNHNHSHNHNHVQNRYHPYQLSKSQTIQYLQIPISPSQNSILINNGNSNSSINVGSSPNSLNNSSSSNIYSSSSPGFSPLSPYQSSPYSSPFPSPKGVVPPQLFLCSTPSSIDRSSSPPTSMMSSPRDICKLNSKPSNEVGNNYTNSTPTPTSTSNINSSSSSVTNSPNSGSANAKGFYGMTSRLLGLCQAIDNERGVSKEKTKMLTELHDELDQIIKKINKVKKNKLPYPPLPSDDSNKSFIDLRPRRNRKCKLSHKENEDNIQCQRCGTKDTPEWRKGPDGCKSLCNACGLYYAKTKKREQEQDQEKDEKISGNIKSSVSSNNRVKTNENKGSNDNIVSQSSVLSISSIINN